MDSSNVCGPLHTKWAIKEFTEGLENILKQNGKIVHGGKTIEKEGGYYVEPTIVEISPFAEIVKEELFVPILYIFKFETVDEAI